MEPTGVQKKKRVHKYMRHLSCISKVMEPTGVHNSTSIGSTCNYTAHICPVCLSGQSDGSVGPPDRSVDSADRSAGRWVGRRHRADTEANVISPTTSHSNSEHCPRKKNVTLASTSCRHSPPFGPDNATWSRIMWFLNISLPSQHWRAANEPRNRAP